MLQGNIYYFPSFPAPLPVTSHWGIPTECAGEKRNGKLRDGSEEDSHGKRTEHQLTDGRGHRGRTQYLPQPGGRGPNGSWSVEALED